MMKHFVYLSTFLAVYRNGSMTLAAKQLGISQASISLHIRLLEDMLGKSLFRRKGRIVHPTTDANNFALLITDYIDGIKEAVDSFSSYSEIVKGVIKIGAIPERIAYSIIPNIHVCIDKKINFEFLNLHNDKEITQNLMNESIDFGILDDMPLNAQIEYIDFYKIEYALIGSKRWIDYLHPFKDPDDLYKKLKDTPWIAYDHQLFFIKHYIEVVFQKSATFIKPPTLSIVFPNIFGVLQAAVCGLGVSVLPQHYCAQYFESNKLVKLFVPDRVPSSFTYLAWKKGRLLNKRMKIFKDILSNLAKSENILKSMS